MIRRTFTISACTLMCLDGITRGCAELVDIDFNAGVEDFLAEAATDPAISHSQLGLGDAEQGVAIGTLGLHDETLAQSVKCSAFCFTFSGQQHPVIPFFTAVHIEICLIGQADGFGLVGQYARQNDITTRAAISGQRWRQLHKRP